MHLSSPPPPNVLSAVYLFHPCLFRSPSPAVLLVQCLQSGDQDVLVKSLKKPPECSLKREGLRAVSLLLRDPRGKVCSAASSLLRSLADQTRHRERVRYVFTNLLQTLQTPVFLEVTISADLQWRSNEHCELPHPWLFIQHYSKVPHLLIYHYYFPHLKNIIVKYRHK